MNALAVVLKPVNHGWVVALTDGRELARFTGPPGNGERCATWPASTNAGGDHGMGRRSAYALAYAAPGARGLASETGTE
jgi:hypothetical protein